MAHDVPAGAVIPTELLLVRDGKASPDALSEWSQLIHYQSRIHPIRTKTGAVLFHQRHCAMQIQSPGLVRREVRVVAAFEMRQWQKASARDGKDITAPAKIAQSQERVDHRESGPDKENVLARVG